MPDGSVDTITNQTNKTAAKTTLSLDLDNFGDFVSGGTSPDFSINGHVVIGGTTYDGTLLQAQAQEFGYSNTITTADAEFDVRLTITGGLLTQSGGPYHVGDSLAAVIHQPGLTIGSFPQSFSVSNSLPAVSDTAHLPPQQFCLSTRQPETTSTRPPITGAQSDRADHRSRLAITGRVYDLRPDAASASAQLTSDEQPLATPFPGRWQRHGRALRRRRHHADDRPDHPRPRDRLRLTLTYRSDVVGTDECCGGWEMSYEQHLVVVSPTISPSTRPPSQARRSATSTRSTTTTATTSTSRTARPTSRRPATTRN